MAKEAVAVAKVVVGLVEVDLVVAAWEEAWAVVMEAAVRAEVQVAGKEEEAKGEEVVAPARMVGMREVEEMAVVLAVGMVEVAMEVGMVVAVWEEG